MRNIKFKLDWRSILRLQYQPNLGMNCVQSVWVLFTPSRSLWWLCSVPLLNFYSINDVRVHFINFHPQKKTWRTFSVPRMYLYYSYLQHNIFIPRIPRIQFIRSWIFLFCALFSHLERIELFISSLFVPCVFSSLSLYYINLSIHVHHVHVISFLDFRVSIMTHK